MNKYLYAGIGIVCSLALALILYKTYDAGRDSIQRKWDIHEAERTDLLLAEKLKYSQLQDKLSAYVESSRKTLQDKENEYQTNLAAIADSYADGLLDSEKRAARYQRQAQNGSSECRGLADHATRLDRSIVEGQNMVRQLIKALERRNTHVEFIGGILIEEQKLFTGE